MPEQAISRVLFSVSVTPLRNSDHSSEGIGCPIPLATNPEARTGRPQTLLYLVLLRVGFTQLPRSPGELVRSYRTFSPLPCEIGASATSQGGIFSVALSFVLPRLRVTERPALWSSDFPPASAKKSRTRAIAWPALTFVVSIVFISL